MYNAFKSLVKSKKIFVIAAFQLALGLSLLNYTSSLTLNYKKKTETLKTLFKIENTYTSKAMLNDSDFNGYKVIEELDDNIYLQEYLERFEKVCLENSFMPQVINLEEAINLAIGNLDRELIQTIILGSSLTFLSIIGIQQHF